MEHLDYSLSSIFTENNLEIMMYIGLFGITQTFKLGLSVGEQRYVMFVPWLSFGYTFSDVCTRDKYKVVDFFISPSYKLLFYLVLKRFRKEVK